MPRANCCMKVSSKRAANASLISSVILTEITSTVSSLLHGFPGCSCRSPDFELDFGGRALDDLASCQCLGRGSLRDSGLSEGNPFRLERLGRGARDPTP